MDVVNVANVFKCNQCGLYFDRINYKRDGFEDGADPIHVCFECAAPLREFLTEWWNGAAMWGGPDAGT